MTLAALQAGALLCGCDLKDSTLITPAGTDGSASGAGGSNSSVSVEPVTTAVDAGAPNVEQSDGGNAILEPPLDDAGSPPFSGLQERPPSIAFLNLPEAANVAAQGWVAVAAFPHLSFNTAVSLTAGPGTGHLFVTEREGRVYAFPNEPGTTEKKLVLDLSAVTQGGGDSGLLGLAFHPEFGQPNSPNRQYVYLHYAYSANPIVGQQPPDATPTMSRLARFTIDPDTLVLDPSSELILIDQYDEHVWHQGGSMFFKPDGFLYLGVGDEGAYRCEYANCQRIDKDLFGGVLRIDVDMKGGNISHPIPRQPATGTTANYYIPNDNPFVGRPGVLEEFYALGLRMPWKMSYDAQDDIAWIGEVGEVQHEELDVLQPGANYQWNIFEGTLPAPRSVPDPIIGNWTGPVIDFTRAEAAAIVGGYVYRGSALPYLYGKYIFADFIKGSIWALSYGYDGTRVTARERELLVASPLRDRVNGITAFGVDENRELYFTTFGATGKVYRLARTDGFSNAPAHLSETGAFTNTETLTPSPGLVPYAVQSPLYSDGASKSRWISVPEGEQVQFSQDRSWKLPAGSVLVKHFEIALDESHPEAVRRLETRFLVTNSEGVYGLTYKWNQAGTDADLLLESQTEEIAIQGANGQTRSIRYFYPGPGDCVVCHNSAAGSALGLRTSQLNGDFLYPGSSRPANQLFTWGQIGLLDAALSPSQIRALGHLVPLTDETTPLEARIRSYWAANCSMCHGVLPGIQAHWDARYETPLAQQGVVWVTPSGATGLPNDFLIAPGAPENSLLYRRSSSTNPGYRMPPLGRSSADPMYVQQLEQWIQELGQTYPTPPSP
ncbi:MAG TPA: PQQ-dependent sugar dehydrogenase [Polyangiaceae bacterium]|nr:PQQ-dependent sugar dehydrogenase [Polyangiaceae bacterium]